MSGVAFPLNVKKKKIMSLGILTTQRLSWKGHYSIIEHKQMISTVIHWCWQPASFCPALVLLPAWWPLTPQPPHCKSTASTASDPGHAFSTTGSFSNPTFFVRVFTVPPTSHAIHFTSGLKIWLSKRLIWLLCALLMGLSCFREEEWTQEVEKLKWERANKAQKDAGAIQI